MVLSIIQIIFVNANDSYEVLLDCYFQIFTAYVIQ